MARLPTPGSDSGNWGTILNEFLSLEHSTNGTHKHQPLNVKSYGATGDGSTNDSSAVSAAISALPSAGGVIYFPQGTYLVNLALTNLTNVKFLGAGFNSIIKPYTLNAIALDIQDSSYITIEDLAFDGRYTDGATATTTLFEDITGLFIRHCKFSNPYVRGLNVPARFSFANSRNKYIEIASCEFESTHLNGLYVGQTERLYIHHNLIKQAPDTGIDTGSYGGYSIITDNIILSCGTGIIVAETNRYTVVANNIVLEVANNGININQETVDNAMDPENFIVQGNIVKAKDSSSLSGMTLKLQKGIVKGNLIQGFGSQAVRIQAPIIPPTSGTAAEGYILFEGNLLDSPSANYAIDVAASDVTIINNSFILPSSVGGVKSNQTRTQIKNNIFQGGDPAVSLQSGAVNCDVSNNTFQTIRNGILLAAATDTVVANNNFFNSVFSQDIVESSTADRNQLHQNLVKNSGAITIVGASTKVSNNINFTTERNSTATIPNGSTSVAVTHNMHRTPALKDIKVTPTNSMGNATKFWITSANATTFTINVDVDPGATTATFAWDIVIR